MPIAEMQARVFFAALTGEAPLPSNAEMRMDVTQKLTAMRKQFYGSPRHTLQCSYAEMMDELATLIGCRPEFWPTFLEDPLLAIKQTFGPAAPYIYRVKGPHKWDGARDAIFGISDRIQAGFNQGGSKSKQCETCLIQTYLPYVIVVFVLAYFLL